MKRFIAMSLIPVMALLFTFISCGTKIYHYPDTAPPTEGWVDDNTYRITVEAGPRLTLKNRDDRRKSSKRAAIQNAQYLLHKKFMGAEITYAPSLNSSEQHDFTKISEIIKKGYVLRIIYDYDDNCQIIYEVKAERLKKMVDDYNNGE